MSKRLTRVLSLILTLVMFLSVSTTAFALGGGELGDGWDRDIGEDEILTPDPAEEPEEEYDEDPNDYFSSFDETGLTVTVEAPMGALPTLAEVRAERVEAEAVQDVVNATADAEHRNVVLAVDISFWFNGQEIEPDMPVRVKVAAPELEDKTDLALIHIPDAAEPETMNLLGDDQMEYELAPNEVAFESASFSVYVFTGGGDETPVVTYNFVDGAGNPYPFLNTAGQTVTSQKIKNGEALLEVPAPGLYNNQAFVGWFYEDGTEVKFGEAITVTETKDVTIKAYYGSVIYVTFWQYAAGKVVLERKQIAKNNDGKYIMDLRSVTVPAPKTTLKFMGWSLTEGTDASEDSGDTVGSRPLLPNGNYEFTEDTDVYPVYYSGLWIVFVSAQTGQGATYVPSFFISGDSANASAAEPTDPTMTGYTFDDWYTEEEPVEEYVNPDAGAYGTKFNFSTSFADLANYTNERGEVVLYGHWKPGNTTYVVVYWKQQVGNDKDADESAKTYDYAGQTSPITAATGSKPTPTTAHQAADTGFEYARYTLMDTKDDGSAPVASNGLKADGSTILNVYFDRKTITMRFYKTAGSSGYGSVTAPAAYNSNRWTNSSYTDIYDGLYGQTWSQAGYDHDWPSPGTGSYWVYFNSNYTNENSTTVNMSQYSQQGTIMTYLGQFILPEGVHDSNEVEIRLFKISAQTSTVSYYLQNVNGTYPTSTTITGAAPASGTFSFSDKYEGFKVVQYRQGNGSWQNVSSTTNSDGSHNYTPASISVNGDLSIRYERLSYDIKYLNPMNESEVVTKKSLLFGASLSTAKPTATSIDLGVAGYEWDGKWYKDKSCTVEFNFATETMPLGGTKVYAGKTPIYFFIKIDPNGGELQTGQATWRWVMYGDDSTYTYDNITRDYIEYKGSGTAYYYYYDEFDISRRDDIWNYTYMNTNPRTARYVEDASQIPSGGGAAWLGSEKFSKEADAYALIGWYDVTDGVANMKPFKTGTAITRDTIIQAQWRRTGEYLVNYSVEAVDASGNPLLYPESAGESAGTRVMGANSPVDGAKYADKSDSAIMDKMGVIPAGYNFVGWWYNGKMYEPGDVFQVLASVSDDLKTVHIYPVLEPVETLPVEVINITFDPNGGQFTSAADTEIAAIITAATSDDSGTYKPAKVDNADGTKTINNLKLNETFDVLSAASVERGVVIDGTMVPGRGYKLKEWNTKADGSGTSFGLDYQAGIDDKEPIPNTLYAIWDELIYIYHPSTSKFESVVITDPENPVKERWEYTNGFDPEGTKDKTQYTTYYYGGYAVYAAGNEAAAGLTFEAGDVKTGSIADSYWTRVKAAKSADLWNTKTDAEAAAESKVAGTGAVYYLKEVPTSYLAQPVAASIRDNYGAGDITSLHFLSVTDTNIYRQGGIKLNGTDTRGTFAKNFVLTKHNGSTTTITSLSQFGLEGYLTVVNAGTTGGQYSACQAYWLTYDNVKVYGIEANIRDIDIG